MMHGDLKNKLFYISMNNICIKIQNIMNSFYSNEILKLIKIIV